jgi:Na+-translocating ferredoxin:NAD+ oxidoreductase RnfD subunit
MKSAPTLAARNARFLAALAPGAVLACLSLPGLGPRLAVAAAFALCFETLCLRLRGLPLRAYLAEGSAVRAGLLLALWLPSLSLSWLLVALGLALLLRQCLGGLGGAPFHAAMVGTAIAQLAFAAGPMAPDAGAPWLALAWLAGGLALVALGQVRWQGPVALLATAGLCAGFAGHALSVFVAAPWLLAAFFLLPESGGDGESATVRLLVGVVAGALAVLCAPGTGVQALPYALLVGNALAPALSRTLAARRRRPA